MKNKMKCQAKRIISIAEDQSSSELYMVIDFVLLDTLVNLNNIQYSESFITNISDNSSDYAGIPLKVDYAKLIAGKTDKLTHNYNPKTQSFSNQMIGSFVKFYTQRNSDDVLELCGQVRIPKEFGQACEIIQQLYDDENLFVSYEIIVGDCTKTGGITFVDASENNYLFAYSIVSNPAVTSATAFALIAELNQTIEGAEHNSMERNKNFTQEEMFKNTKVTLVAELDINQIQRKIYYALQTFIKDNWYNYDVEDQTMTYIIVKQWDNADLFKIDYAVSETDVTLSNMRKTNKKYEDIVEGEDPMTIAELQLENSNLKLEIANKETKLKDTEVTLASVNSALETKETELTEANAKISMLSASVLEKDNKIKELEPVQEKYNTLIAEQTAKENEVKKVALKDKYSKLLSAEVLAETEIAEALNKLDESKLNARVVEIAMASATKVIQTASRITDEVKIGKGEDVLSKYVTVNNN